MLAHAHAHMHMHQPLGATRPHVPTHRRSAAVTSASKGFGKAQTQQALKKRERKGAAGSKKKPPQQQSRFIEDEERERAQPRESSEQRELAERFRTASEGGQSIKGGGSGTEFEQRLAQLAQRTPAQRQESQQREEPQDILALEPQFGRVPKPRQEEKESDAADDGQSSGLAKAGVAVGSLALVGIFIASSFKSDFVASTSQSPAGGGAQQLGSTERKEVEVQAAKFQEQLTASPDSVDALEGAAVSYAKLGDLKQASTLLKQLSQKKPEDPDVWRLLAETRALQGDQSGATEAYKTANEKSSTSDIDLLSGWADSLVKEKKPQQAVDMVKGVRQGASGEFAVDLDLLQGRIFSQWKGHDSDAIAIYDRLAERSPDDFRPPLAKGLILKSEGRKGDAARYFMKARYLAPTASRNAVDELVARQQQQ